MIRNESTKDIHTLQSGLLKITATLLSQNNIKNEMLIKVVMQIINLIVIKVTSLLYVTIMFCSMHQYNKKH